MRKIYMEWPTMLRKLLSDHLQKSNKPKPSKNKKTETKALFLSLDQILYKLKFSYESNKHKPLARYLLY